MRTVSEQVDFTELEKFYNDSANDRKQCPTGHRDALSIDENGVYHINCKACGVSGMTSESGARALGWIE
jgi:hypothetical protein